MKTTIVPVSSPRVLQNAVLREGATTSRSLSQAPRRSIWHAATRTIASLLLNASLSSAAAFFAMFCVSRGDYLVSLEPPKEQSRAAFAVAAMLWVHCLTAVATITVRAAGLVRTRFVAKPMYRPTLIFCLWRICRRTWIPFVGTFAIDYVIGLGVTSLDQRWRKYKLELCLSSIITYAFMASVEFAARQIYRNETVQGQRRLAARAAESRSRGSRHGSPANPPRRVRQWPLWCLAYRRRVARFLQVIPPFIALFVPTLFTILAIHRPAIISPRRTTLFTAASVAAKLMMQEAARVFIIRRRVLSPRSMAVLLGLPTVLVDTQVRIIMCRAQNTQSTVLNTLLMAAIEVVVRLVKMGLVQWKIRRRRRHQQHRQVHVELKVATATEATPASPATKIPTLPTHELTTRGPADSTSSLQLALHRWTEQTLACHVSELYADMYAEYLAIGCSSAVLFFGLGHRHFDLMFEGSDEQEETTTMIGATTTPGRFLALQVGVEVVVDWLCAVLEMKGGLNLAVHEKELPFFRFFFLSMAVGTINISALLYLRA